MYVVGQKKLEQAVNVELPKLKAMAEETGLVEDLPRLMTMLNLLIVLKRKSTIWK